jgi:GNAT superfamily N-acetyltransferase
MHPNAPVIRAIAIRPGLAPGDLGAVVRLHGLLYAKEYGFDLTFEVYVAGPLAEFAQRHSPREQIWLAESGDRLVGVVGIVTASDELAQLRWFLVDPESRGHGLGTALLRQAVDFAETCGYGAITLWTVSALAAASRVYRDAGFQRVEERPGRRWGVDVVEERYEKRLR